jgi:sec-independent protein translocase protein TatB
VFGIELGEMFTLGVVALLIFGPERLPEVAVKAAHFIRRMRSAADSARSELSTSLGTDLNDLDLRELDPRTFIKRHVLDPADEDGVLRGLRTNGSTAVDKSSAARAAATAKGQGAALPPAMAPTPLQAGERPPFDAEAT